MNNSGTVDVGISIVPLVVEINECVDEIDNDMDGFLDLNDPGCQSDRDDNELDEIDPPACNDGVDNDNDSLTDYPNDPDCLAAGDPYEVSRCDTLPSVDVQPTFETPVTITVNPPNLADPTNSTSCGPQVGQAEVIYFEVPEISDVTVSITGSGDALYVDQIVELRSDCDDLNSVLLLVSSIGLLVSHS